MWCDTRIFFFFLCYATLRHGVLADDISDFENLVERLGIESSGSNDMTTTVHINGHEYQIFDPSTTGATEKGYHKDTLNKFFVCMNCVFAKCIQSELFGLIKIFPVLFNRNFGFMQLRKNISVVKNVNIENHLTYISQKITEFVDVLLHFFKIHTYLTYLDTTVLKAFISLHFKIDYIGTLYDDKKKFNELRIDVDVVKTIMDTINDLQIFMTANCPLSEKYDDNMFFPYFELPPNRFEMIRFLTDIQPLGLKVPEWYRCTTEKMLLENFLSADAPTNMLQAMWYIPYDVGCDSEMSFSGVLDIAKTSYDLQLIHWYQETIMNTLLTILFTKVVLFFNHQYDFEDPNPQSYMNEFKIIHSEFLSAYFALPAGVTEFFNVVMFKDKFERADVKMYTDMASVLDKVRQRPVGKFNLNDTTEDKPEIFRVLARTPLGDFLKFITENIEKFKCFTQSFAVLNKEYYTYYMPFKRDYNKVIETIFRSRDCQRRKKESSLSSKTPGLFIRNVNNNFTTEGFVYLTRDNVDYSKSYSSYKPTSHITLDPDTTKSKHKYNIRLEGCHLFTALYYYCVDALRIINRAFETGSKREFMLARLRLGNIKAHLIKANELSFNHRIQTVIYDVLPHVDVHFERRSKVFGVNFFRRIMSILPIELSYYGLEYCGPPNHDFLTSNAVREFGELKDYDRVVQRYFKRVEITRKLEGVDASEPSPCPKTMSLSSVFGNYSKHQDTLYVVYDDAIKLKWKGEGYKSIREIHHDIMFNVPQPFYYYSFADVYLKFSFAVVFYEVAKFQRNNDRGLSETDCKSFFEIYMRQERVKFFKTGKFPFSVLTGHITTYMETVFFYLCKNENNEKHTMDTSYYSAVFGEFQRLGVFIDLNSETRQSSTPSDDTNEEQNYSGSQLSTDNLRVAHRSREVVRDSKTTVTTNKVFKDVVDLMYDAIFKIDQNLQDFVLYIFI